MSGPEARLRAAGHWRSGLGAFRCSVHCTEGRLDVGAELLVEAPRRMDIGGPLRSRITTSW